MTNQTEGYALWNNYVTVIDGSVPQPTQIPVPREIITQFFAYPVLGNAPIRVDFSDASTGNPVSWDWNFGDRTHSSLENPSHIYASTGSYPVTLSATNAKYSGSNHIQGDHEEQLYPHQWFLYLW